MSAIADAVPGTAAPLVVPASRGGIAVLGGVRARLERLSKEETDHERE
ncbi:hypothetical protein AAD018_004270 [Aestuariibius insulae]